MPRRLFAGAAASISVCMLAGGCMTRPEPSSLPSSSPRSTGAVQASGATPRGGSQPAPSSAAETALRPVEVVAPSAPSSIRISPEDFTIAAEDPGLQLLVVDRNDDGRLRDLTAQVSWRAQPAGLALVEPGGYLRPLAAGAVEITASVSGRQVVARARIEPRAERSWSFADDVVPVLSRLGCNMGSCHGRGSGQNGFRLSLLGYDPEADYRAIVRDGGQRRIALLSPERSLLLVKATGQAPHGGGMRTTARSPEYRVLRDWIMAGAPALQGKTHGRVVRVHIDPPGAWLGKPGPLQFRVMAHHADGHTRDVTRQALYKTNDEAALSVDVNGLARLASRGEADVIVRYQSFVLNARLGAAVNPDLQFDFAGLPRHNLIDEELFKRLAALKVPPSPPVGDAGFLRRLSLDLTGQQPTPARIREFLADTSPDKRSKLVDRLLSAPEFVLFWRIKLGDLLQISPARQGNSAYVYQEWVDRCLTENVPWNVMVTRMLTALGDPSDRDSGGPVNYALDALEPTVQAEQTAQRFLGLRMRCAQCHDHPFDVWTQDDYFGLAALFARVQRSGIGAGAMGGRTTVTLNPKGQVLHLRTKQPARPRLLGGPEVDPGPGDDPRAALARWMCDPKNPLFARAMVNWTWAQLFGRGLVEPADDMSRANPPVHPDLLDALARHFVNTNYDLRGLIRTITTSATYGFSSATVPGNERDTRFFSHHLPRPLTAHQMADALAQATDVPNTYGALRARLAIQIASPSVPSMILDTFGRCQRSAGCAPVQTPPLSLKQALLVIGGDVIESKVAHLNGYLANALKLELEPEELVENLYLRTVCRLPTPEESSRWASELKQAASLREAAEDLFWSLLNAREFAFNH